MRGIRKTITQSLFGVCAILSAAGLAAANPIPIPPPGTPTEGVYQLFLTNFPVDMLLFSVLLLVVLWKLKSPLRAHPKNANELIARIVASGIVIAVTGALIDFYFFYTYFEYTTYAGVTYDGYYPRYMMMLSTLTLAAIAVFISVVVVSVAVVRLKLRPSLMTAAAMAAFNFVAWELWDYGMILEDGDAVVLLAGAMFLFVPPVMFRIVHMMKAKEAAA